jgi:hypothetical protein
LASVILKPSERPANYGYRKVWQFGLEVGMKIKGSQGRKRVEWVNIEHPFTAISASSDVHANRKIVPYADGQVPVLLRFSRRETRQACTAIADGKILMLKIFVACNES